MVLDLRIEDQEKTRLSLVLFIGRSSCVLQMCDWRVYLVRANVRWKCGEQLGKRKKGSATSLNSFILSREQEEISLKKTDSRESVYCLPYLSLFLSQLALSSPSVFYVG